MGDAADDAERRAQQEIEDGDAYACQIDESAGLAGEDDGSFGHCMVCGERFMGEEKAEVTLKADPSEYHRHLIIHQTCFDPEKHEVA